MKKKLLKFPSGLQCPQCYVGYGDKTDVWDTQEHRDKYHRGKQGCSKFPKKNKIIFHGLYVKGKRPKNLKFPKPKKVEKRKSYWKRQADILFSKFIRSLDHCEFCGQTKNLQCAHIYSRRYINLRYDIDNCLNLCASCHFKSHSDPLSFYATFLQLWPDRYKKLQKKRQIIKKWTIDDYKKIIQELSNYI